MTILDELVAGASEDALRREALISRAQLEVLVRDAPPVRDARRALAPSGHVAVIAEVKRASPSRGRLAEIPDPGALAASYQTGGASVISVLTEQRQFLGSLDDLRAVRAAVTVPVLRKDFLVSEYQLLEARAAGADMVLLIVAALSDVQLASLRVFASQLGMSALVEAHTVAEVERARRAGAEIIGINARNLRDFSLNTDLFGAMASAIPPGVIRVAESAVKGVADVQKYRAAGADAVLVGEALVTGDAEALIAEFRAVGARTEHMGDEKKEHRE